MTDRDPELERLLASHDPLNTPLAAREWIGLALCLVAATLICIWI